tara:strand:+ start:312 stop:482 length:171 start_codon:yes stop_codon:yes gene_type:complete
MNRDVTELPWLVVSPFLGVVATFYLNVEAVKYCQLSDRQWQVINRKDYKTNRDSDE